MESRQVVSVSKGRLAGNILLALLFGALLPLIAVIQISLLAPVLMLGGIIAARMKARVGWAPVGVLFVAALTSALWLLELNLTLVLALASLLPAVVVIRGMAKKQPFFEQMRNGVMAFALGLLAALAVAYLSFGSGMIARFTELMRREFARMPDAAMQPIVDALNSTFSLGGVSGNAYTVELYRTQLYGVLDLMEKAYAQALPGALLSGALLSGVICVLWGNWTMARLGLATNESFVGMSGWFLPAQITFGALGLWVAGLVMSYGGYSAGATVLQTVRQLAGTAFVIQALASMDRRMLASGRELSRRRLMITLMAVAALAFAEVAMILSIIGAASALFGSHGAISRRANDGHDQSDRDDPQK